MDDDLLATTHKLDPHKTLEYLSLKFSNIK